jgi:hypothetical protein
VPPVDEPGEVVDDAVPVLGVETSAHDASVAGATVAPGVVPGVVGDAVEVSAVTVLTFDVPAVTALAPVLTALEHVVAEPEPSCRPAAPFPVDVPVPVLEALVRPAAPVAGVSTAPPLETLCRTLALTGAGRTPSALSASFGAVETVASTAPAMACNPLVPREPAKAPGP